MADWVFIVDDDAVNLKYAGDILDRIGIKVTALKSGQELLDFFREAPFSTPDLILMDVFMPDMDGFETLKALRRQQEGKAEIPVIFLSADQKQESETRGFRLGATDFIRKPLIPEVLTGRVQNALRTQEKLQRLERNAMVDRMTGFLNKDTIEERMKGICQVETGFLCVLDLDSFKLINDIYGHDMGDQALIVFSDLLKNNMRAEDVCGRIGGDEFMLFAKNMRTEGELRRFTERINQDYLSMLNHLLGDRVKFPTGVSIGAAAVPTHGREYRHLFHLADQALNMVKQTEKHGCALSGSPQANLLDPSGKLNLESITMILEERSISPNAMWMGREAFINIYRYMMRYMGRYHGVAYRVLFTVTPAQETVGSEHHVLITEEFRQLIQESLRNSDVMVEVSNTQIFLLLPETHEMGISVVINRLIDKWNRSKYHDKATVTWEAGPVHLPAHGTHGPETQREEWVVVVDDDSADRDVVKRLLVQQQMHVTTLASGSALLDFLQANHPDLILLDAGMPEPDGLETLRRLKESWGSRSIPVILITDDQTGEAEVLGLQLGAEDCIRKPFLPEILTIRVRHMMDLIRCQRYLTHEVEKKTEDDRQHFIRVIRALTAAMDEKSADTKEHSSRVARYAREIARRYGYSREMQDDIYMMGLLHDVGRIALPDTVNSKPGRLTEPELEIIQTHTVTGAKILQEISELHYLAVGARWHHERYDGGGYPDGLAGERIPEQARIIAVADAYEAMSNHRSYRDDLTREDIRRELRLNAGSQFDPRFADIMLAMMEEERDPA